MFSSLRSRLLLSYCVVISLVLFVVGLALLALSAGQTTRLLPSLRQLSGIAQGARREIAQLSERGANLQSIQENLTEIALEQDVRIALLDRDNSRVFFDSQVGDGNWLADRLDRVDRPPGDFSRLDANLPIGRYRAPDGSTWTLYSQPLGERAIGRFLLLVARPEPTFLEFFRETFVRPLCQAGLIAFLFALLLAILITRSVTRPLLKLAEASELMAQGEYEQQIPLEGPDELKQVAVSFNTMAVQVASAQTAQRDLVANVSHDLKTPLTSIRGWSQALLDGAATTPKRRQHAASVIHAETERMTRMVDHLLDLARLESGQLQLVRQPVDLPALLSRIHDGFLNAAVEKGVQIVLNVNPVPPVSGDADRLSQVFMNLVDNALAHTPTGGRIQLSVYPYGSDTVEVIVQDNGSGIPASELVRVFERFYQLDKSRATTDIRQGAGLGLAIVKELVAAHGGQIAVHSQLGQGSTFTIRLPVNEGTVGDRMGSG